MEINHEIFASVILSLLLIQEGQLSVSDERMCTILVNHLEDKVCAVRVLRQTDRARHDPIGLTGPLNLNTKKLTFSIDTVSYLHIMLFVAPDRSLNFRLFVHLSTFMSSPAFRWISLKQ